MAKFRNIETGLIYEPSCAEVEEQFASSDRFEAVEEPKKDEPTEAKAPRRRATKAKSE